MTSVGNNLEAPPRIDELEVSIFGPGFGECIVLHTGNGNWGVIDSCLDPTTKKPAALQYLNSLRVPVEASVRFVIASHWHDDHMQGISETFKHSQGAIFACTGAVRTPEFKEVLAAWGESRFSPAGSGVDELREIFEQLRVRQPGTRYPAPRVALAKKIIWEDRGKVSTRLVALSPSDAAILAAITRLATATPNASRTRRRLPNLKQNDVSVVLSLEVGDHRVLLGADLEVRHDRGLGWMAVVDSAANPNSFHHGLKVSHHGSPTADHDDIWNRLLVPQPWAVTTPFVSGRVRLPSKDDCQRLLQRTRDCYLTAPPQPTKFRDPDKTVEKTVGEATISAQFIPGKYGHVRFRKGINDPADAAWRVETFGNALKMDDYIRH